MAARPVNAAMDKKSRKAFDVQDFREMLSPAYYRHEFARRNKTVAEASADLLKHFPFTASRAEGSGFIRLEKVGHTTLVDDLTREFEIMPESAKAKARQALAGYAREYGILPVLPPPQTFFPEIMGAHALLKASPESRKSKTAALKPAQSTQLTAILLALINYEKFLLAKGMVKAPCFMPVVPSPWGTGGGGASAPDGESLQQPSANQILVVCDLSEKRGVLENYFHFLLESYEVHNVRHSQDAVPKIESKTHWQTYEECLMAYDLKQRETKKSLYQQAVEFRASVKGGALLDPSLQKKSVYHAVADYRSRLESADKHIRNFRKIGKSADL